MKKGKIRVLWAAAGLLVIMAMLLVSAGCSSSSDEGEKVLKVGMIIPATGPAAEKGKPGGDGVLDAMEYINTELNGADGYDIEVLWRDSAYDASKVAVIVKDFKDAGALMFTTMASAEMTAAMTIANRDSFPGLVTFAANSNYNPPEHIYAHSPDYGDDWVAFADYYLDNIWQGSGNPKMALCLLNNTTGSTVGDIAKAKAAEMGIDIIDISEHKADTISEMDSLTAMKSKNPDVIYIASTPKPTSVILKNAKDLGILDSGVAVGLGHAALAKSLVDLAGSDIVEGVYGVYPTVTWDDDIPGIAKAKEYAEKNNPADVGNMDYLSCWNTSLVVAEILRTAVKNAGYDALKNGDAAAWKVVEEQGIQKLSGYDVEGLQGSVAYTAGNNNLGKYVKIYRIESGNILPVSDWIATR